MRRPRKGPPKVEIAEFAPDQVPTPKRVYFDSEPEEPKGEPVSLRRLKPKLRR